ncbi:hypothetical protein FACS1894187_05090 [Synergistales bacterium]|nr:hypothetical protein FACS1894187_05090 [Synergistales bacterium]
MSNARAESIDFIMPYAPRHYWERELHAALWAHRFSVLVAHRRFGKTVGVINHMIMSAVKNTLPMPRYAYIAPFRVQAKAIAWQYLKQYTAPLGTYRQVNESGLSINLPSMHAGVAGAMIQIHGADNPDSLRGVYWDGVILDEYAQMKRELWEEVMLPALLDRKGWAVFIGTPKGQNAFFEIYQKAQIEKGWHSGFYRADETGVISQEDLEDLRVSMSNMAWRQEMLCDFTASAFDVLIPIDLIARACAKRYTEWEIGSPSEVVLGVDVARFGDDNTAAVLRKGLIADSPQVWHGLDSVDVADRIGLIIQEHRPDAVFVDAGRGEGVIDHLRHRGYIIMEIPFGARALDEAHYANRVTEMYDKLKLWMTQGGSLPNLPELKTELAGRRYDFDTRGRMRLESKDKYKERMGGSPDSADALALTLAAPVYRAGTGRVIEY